MSEQPKHPHPWLFALTAMPYGVVGTFTSSVMTYRTREAGIDVGSIGWYFTLLMVPTFVLFLYAPIVDIGPRRKHWLLIVTVLGAACLVAACMTPLPDNVGLFLAFSFASQALTALVGACNGGLLATSMPDHLRGKASGALNIGNLCGGGLSGTVAVFLISRHFSPVLVGLALAVMMIGPALAVLAVVEPPRNETRTPREIFRGTLGDIGAVLFSKKGITGILLCLSPVGTAALINYFNAIGVDYVRPAFDPVVPDAAQLDICTQIAKAIPYHIDLGGLGLDHLQAFATKVLTDDAILERVGNVLIFTTGPLGIALTALGAYIGGWACDRTNRRAMYLLSGALTALCGLVMAVSPRVEMTLIVGALTYQLITGFCYSAFTATVLETIGKAGKSASTQYTLFVAAGNGAITWVGLVDTRFAESHGPEGVIGSDAILNIAGVVVLTCVFAALGTFGKSKHSKEADVSADETEPAKPKLPEARLVDRD